MPIKNGDTVFVHYTGTLDDGTVFDSSREREPLEFVVGSGTIIPGFEAAVLGREKSDKVAVDIAPADAYGEHNAEMVIIVPRSEVPEHIKPEVGMLLQIALEQGELDVAVSRVDENEVELDGNHPLAGQTLHFDIEVVGHKAA